MTLAKLPQSQRADGQVRRVGAEFEFTGISLQETAEVLQQALGGTIDAGDPLCLELKDSRIGAVRIETDSGFLKDGIYLRALDDLGWQIDAATKHKLGEWLGSHAHHIVPNEIVTDPIPFSQLSALDTLAQAMYVALSQDKVSHASIAPCGLHFNIEMAEARPDAILNIMRAFSVSYDTIVRQHSVAFLRRVFPYIAPYSADYLRLIADWDYQPDTDQLIDDYLHFNPTRNRGLDMLPLFASLDEARVRDFPLLPKLDQRLLKPRPAYHYRLPNCRFEDPEWHLGAQWESWVAIERLAADPERLRREIRVLGETWVEALQRWWRDEVV